MKMRWTSFSDSSVRLYQYYPSINYYTVINIYSVTKVLTCLCIVQGYHIDQFQNFHYSTSITPYCCLPLIDVLRLVSSSANWGFVDNFFVPQWVYCCDYVVVLLYLLISCVFLNQIYYNWFSLYSVLPSDWRLCTRIVHVHVTSVYNVLSKLLCVKAMEDSLAAV